MALVKQNQAVIWVQDGKFEAFYPLAIGEEGSGATGKGISLLDLAPVYGRDRFGRPLLLSINQSPPGDLPSLTLTIFEQDQLNYFEKLIEQGCPVNLQIRYVTCGILDNPNVWSKMQNWGDGVLTVYNPGDGPTETFSGENMTASGTLSFTNYAFLVEVELSAQTTTETQSITSIAGIPDLDCGDCGTGYPGADQLLIAGAEAAGGATAKLLVTSNGGGSWTATSTDPHSIGENIVDVAIRQIEADKARFITGGGGDIAYADVTYGDEATTSWTVVAVSTATAVEALGWLRFETLYIGADGDIYISTDQGESVPASPSYTGANVINGFAISPDGKDVYAFGATNTILLEQNKSGSFSNRVGPSGGGAFTAVSIADDGTLWAGNGTSIFRSNNRAANTGGWTSVKDFGANMAVVAIQCVKGNSQIVRAVVDDSTPGTGEVWETTDGGNSWRQVSAVTNAGYNDAYFSEINSNLGNIAGDASGGLGVLHKLEAA